MSAGAQWVTMLVPVNGKRIGGRCHGRCQLELGEMTLIGQKEERKREGRTVFTVLL